MSFKKHFMKTGSRRIRVTVLLLGLIIPLLTQAADIDVDESIADIQGDNVCSLPEALRNAQNDNSDASDCAAGSGTETDRLLLSENFVYELDFPLGEVNGFVVTTDLEIVGNNARIQRAETAGGFRLIRVSDGGDLTLSDLSMRNGFADNGGAIRVEGMLQVSNVVFEGNHADPDAFFTRGGAVAVMQDAVATIEDSRFTGNTALEDTDTVGPEGGGAIYQETDSTLTIKRSAFINNRAVSCDINAPDGTQGLGGALLIHQFGGNSTSGTRTLISDTTLAGNHALRGGAIYLHSEGASSAVGSPDALLDLTRVTLVLNDARPCAGAGGAQGDGIRVLESGSEPQVVYTGSILHGNGQTSPQDEIIGNDCSWTGSSGTPFLSNFGNVLDPKEGAPLNPAVCVSDGGAGLDALVENVQDVLDLTLRESSYYLPLPEGEAVDLGNTGTCIPGETTDQRGRVRANGSSQGGTVCDAGAIERYSTDAVEPTRDYGDAPEPYPTLGGLDNGASHIVDSDGPSLLKVPDAENDGQPSANADGDDNNNADDEDGVTLPNALLAGMQNDIQVTPGTGANGVLNGWIDFNGDGDWEDEGEQIITERDVTLNLPINISFNVPEDAVTDRNTFARFRISTAGGDRPTGPAEDGEVEDYMVTITALKDVGDDDDSDSGDAGDDNSGDNDNSDGNGGNNSDDDDSDDDWWSGIPGCSLSDGHRRFDPLFPLLLVASMLWLRAQRSRTSP